MFTAFEDETQAMGNNGTNGTMEMGGQCFMHPAPFLHNQFYIVCVFGTFVAAISVLENTLVLYILLTRKYFWRKHYFYLIVIALLDSIFSLAYILVLSTIVFFEYFTNLTIMRIWYAYIVPGQTIVQVAQTSSTYLLVAASGEKFLSAHGLQEYISDRIRFMTIAGSITLSLVLKGPLYFEIKVTHRPYCQGLAEFILMPSDLLYDSEHPHPPTMYNKIYVFWIRHVATVFLPFIILLILNIGIVTRDSSACSSSRICLPFQQLKNRLTSNHHATSNNPKRNNNNNRYNNNNNNNDSNNSINNNANNNGKNNNNGGQQWSSSNNGLSLKSLATASGMTVEDQTIGWVSRARTRVKRAATRTLVTMIVTYLISSGFGVFITAWEHLDYESLASRQNYEFYTYSSDFISIFAVFTCASRLPTYVACDLKFRHYILHWGSSFHTTFVLRMRHFYYKLLMIQEFRRLFGCCCCCSNASKQGGLPGSSQSSQPTTTGGGGPTNKSSGGGWKEAGSSPIAGRNLELIRKVNQRCQAAPQKSGTGSRGQTFGSFILREMRAKDMMKKTALSKVSIEQHQEEQQQQEEGGAELEMIGTGRGALRSDGKKLLCELQSSDDDGKCSSLADTNIVKDGRRDPFHDNGKTKRNLQHNHHLPLTMMMTENENGSSSILTTEDNMVTTDDEDDDDDDDNLSNAFHCSNASQQEQESTTHFISPAASSDTNPHHKIPNPYDHHCHKPAVHKKFNSNYHHRHQQNNSYNAPDLPSPESDPLISAYLNDDEDTDDDDFDESVYYV